MADVINLNRFRKRKAREQADKTAEANRLKYGRSKAERDAERKRRELAERKLEHHRLEDAEQPDDAP